MEFAIRNRSLKVGWEEGIRIAASLGFDGVELVVQEEQEIMRMADSEGASEVVSWCETEGCELSSLSIAPYRRHNFATSDGGFDDGVQFVSHCLRAGAEVGASALLLPHFERERIDLDSAGERRYIEGFRRCAP